MPEPLCTGCQRAFSFALHVACDQVGGDCDKLVQVFTDTCHKIGPQVGLSLEQCDKAAQLLATICSQVSPSDICAEADAFATVLCHVAGVCP